MTADPIRLLIVDDHQLFRQGVLQTLEREPDFQVVGQAASVAEAIQAAEETLPDVVLLDVMLPDGSGLDVLRVLRERVPYSRVLILTVAEQDDVLLRALEEGAHGYLLKGVTASDLVAAVRAVQAGEPTITPALAFRLLRLQAERQGRPQSGDGELTPRERQILERIGAGSTNREIAEALGISEKTVKHYVTNILQKLHLRNRVEAALVARGHGQKES